MRPEYQRQGIGTLLMRQVHSKLPEGIACFSRSSSMAVNSISVRSAKAFGLITGAFWRNCQ
ncbi:MAG: GNAT family N-acetyltransferase [Akkermansia sp.]|nr:GNAT family N-acetyltransferase [Akkermansia sp.]